MAAQGDSFYSPTVFMRGTKLGPHIEVPLPWVPAVKMLIVETLDHNRGKALNEQILSDWISKQMVTLCVTLDKKILNYNL